jgi:hypothetical protein
MLAHLRTEAYPIYGAHRYPPRDAATQGAQKISYEENNRLIDEAKRQFDSEVSRQSD